MSKDIKQNKLSDELINEWHPTKNGDLKPDDVTRGSGKKIWWMCDKGHEWKIDAYNRSKGSGCPYCSNKKILKGFNDLSTTHPELSKEWHPTKNSSLTPNDVTYGSRKKVWWKCNKDHEWEATISNRSNGRGCPHCRKEKQSSFPELAIYFYIKKFFKDAIHGHKIDNTEIDIYIPSLKIGIEYDGVYWHKDKLDKDTNKNIKLMKYGITILRIRENGLERINTSNGHSYILNENKSKKSLEDSIKWIFDKIFVLTDTSIYSTKISIAKDEIEILNMIDRIDKENSIAIKNPELIKEWHPIKNGNLTPYNCSYGSRKKVWWICSKGHEWKTAIGERSNGTGCPYCSNRKMLKGFNDLSTTCPELARQWNSIKNKNLMLDSVIHGSNKKAWWICDEGHEWEAAISSRIQGKGCPYCSNNRVSKGFNDLQTKRPELAKQWNKSRNGDTKPFDVAVNSNKKVWWICDKGHEWESTVGNRAINENGCPYCSGKKTIKGYNDLGTIHSELAKQWHPTKNNNLTPDNVASNSYKKIWWICDRGHEWETTVSNRLNGDGCPYCSNKKILKGFNDLFSTHPGIAKQWHPTKNKNLAPSDVTYGSGKKVWWICDKGHEWEAIISSRIHGRGCPFCSGKKVLKGFNDLVLTHPKLSKQWHPTKNGNLTPDDVSCGSGKKVWWTCSKGHEWHTRVSHRVNGVGCPYCSNSKVLKGYNDLKTAHPELAKQWHPTKNKNLTSESITSGSSKKVWWKCSHCDEEYKRTVYDQVKFKKCPKCKTHIE